jgi:hypothetical protein
MFNERPKPKTEVMTVQGLSPHVYISAEALTKMKIYVDECSDEIGWLGTAYKNEDNTITIEEVFLFDQDVHGATTEITPEGLSDFATELLERGDEGIEIWNNLKMWGHSHVNMGVFASGQDDSQMKTFKDGGHDWFLRLICNKKGEMKIDLYNYEHGFAFLDLPWTELQSEQEYAIQSQINKLYEQLEELEKKRKEEFETPIKAEMKEKVRKMSSLSTVKTRTGVTYYDHKGKLVTEDEQKKSSMTNIKTSGTSTTENTTVYTTDDIYDVPDVFIRDDEVFEFFPEETLLEISDMVYTFAQLEEELTLYGYENYFSQNDIERIYKMMVRVTMDKEDKKSC